MKSQLLIIFYTLVIWRTI